MEDTKHIRISDFDYDLPDGRIAKFPLARRDSSKLLVYRGGRISEDVFSSLPEYIPATRPDNRPFPSPGPVPPAGSGCPDGQIHLKPFRHFWHRHYDNIKRIPVFSACCSPLCSFKTCAGIMPASHTLYLDFSEVTVSLRWMRTVRQGTCLALLDANRRWYNACFAVIIPCPRPQINGRRGRWRRISGILCCYPPLFILY